MPEIGATLREARMRARIDVSEIEAQTKIRAKYLRALENEEWGLLPGPTFVKSFLRTYAQALGLDGKALVEEYRLHHERPSEAALEPIVSSPQQRGRARPGGARPGGGPSRGYVAVVGVIVLLIVLLIVGLLAGGGGSDEQHGDAPPRRATGTAPHARTRRTARRQRDGLAATRRDAVAAADRGGVRVPDRRRRAQADPGHRTAAGREHAHLPRASASRSRSATAR